MGETVAESLARRVERLEKANRRWRGLCLAAMGGLGLILSAGAGRNEPTRLEMRELAVVDRDGKVRLRLGTDDGGDPYLYFATKEGLPRLNMGLGGGPFGNHDPYLNFKDSAGMPRLLMGLGGGPGTEQDAYLNLRSKEQKIIFSAEKD